MKLVRGSWNEDYLQELESFPYGAHDDQVDASAVAFNELAAHSGPRRGWDDVLEIYRRVGGPMGRAMCGDSEPEEDD